MNTKTSSPKVRTAKAANAASRPIKATAKKPIEKPATVEPPIALVEAPPKPISKLAKVIELMSRPEGATISDLSAATNWQAHSVRGAIAGSIKKKLNHVVATEKVEGRGLVYRVTGVPQ